MLDATISVAGTHVKDLGKSFDVNTDSLNETFRPQQSLFPVRVNLLASRLQVGVLLPVIEHGEDLRVTKPGGFTGHDRTDRFPRFFAYAASAMLVVVFLAFSRTFYLRAFFDVTDRSGQSQLPAYIALHGVLLSAWFVLFCVQSWLVVRGDRGTHRRLGWLGAAIAVPLVIVSMLTSYRRIDRALEAGSALSGVSNILLGNILSLLSFVVLLALAVQWRRHPESHKRLMLYASLSIIGPAFGAGDRPIGAFLVPLLPNVQVLRPYSLAIFATIIGLIVFDARRLGRIHRATVLGGVAVVLKQVVARTFGATDTVQGIVQRLSDWT